ncbi:MAG: 4-(cytidine 5'-diphospho)-2-C-methyl-D-erythritol kinase [Cytophagales bacterium]|nr:4-(cytidine 5'-diphospho)-2-C-methyl-D-erythritol kinase [Cytophagales bacterium]
MPSITAPAALTRQAPAKLNLFLHITGQRADGYHLLQSVFVRIDWFDTLHFEWTTDGRITRTDLINETGKPLPEIDLSVRAALALQAKTGIALQKKFGAHITLEKRIPSEAGMGGGSSDAATTLLALNELWQTNLSLPKLCAIGATLGADVPFFLHEQHAWVEGIGERVTPIALPPAFATSRFLIVKPPQGASTPAVFAAPELVRNTKTATIESFAAWTKSNASQQCLASSPELFGRNDLQPVAQTICPDINLALAWFASQGLAGRMTGSGSAVFAQVPDTFQLDAAPSLPAGWLCRLCRLI